MPLYSAISSTECAVRQISSLAGCLGGGRLTDSARAMVSPFHVRKHTLILRNPYACVSVYPTVQTVLTNCLDCGCARVRQCLQVIANCVHCLIRLVVWLCCVYSRGRGDTIYILTAVILGVRASFLFYFSFSHAWHQGKKNDLGTILRGFCCFIVFTSDLPVWLTKRISPLGALIDHITGHCIDHINVLLTISQAVWLFTEKKRWKRWCFFKTILF